MKFSALLAKSLFNEGADDLVPVGEHLPERAGVVAEGLFDDDEVIGPEPAHEGFDAVEDRVQSQVQLHEVAAVRFR